LTSSTGKKVIADAARTALPDEVEAFARTPMTALPS
jgi:hypothetical protein